MGIVYITVNQPLLVCPLLVVLDITLYNHIFLVKYHNLHQDICNSFSLKCTEVVPSVIAGSI